MTIAISLKVNDGLVLAADSASTLIALSPAGNAGVLNVYENANKVFNLRKGLPIGAITWGAGNIGHASISTLAKDARRRFAGEDPDHSDWHLDEGNYTVEAVAERFREFMYEELYVPEFGSWTEKPELGFIVAGYSSGASMAEEYQISVDASGQCPPPDPVQPQDETGVIWNGEPEAITRLVLGFGTELPAVLVQDLGVPQSQVGPALDVIKQRLQRPFVQPAMPLQDAIDLAKFLVELTVQYKKFDIGAPTVGGPVEIAAISKHEGFKWVSRKHYYGSTLNPSA